MSEYLDEGTRPVGYDAAKHAADVWANDAARRWLGEASEQNDRKNFELWCVVHKLPIERDEKGEYAWSDVRLRYEGWAAAKGRP